MKYPDNIAKQREVAKGIALRFHVATNSPTAEQATALAVCASLKKFYSESAEKAGSGRFTKDVSFARKAVDQATTLDVSAKEDGGYGDSKRGGPIPTGCFSTAHSNKRKKYARQACSLFSSEDRDHVPYCLSRYECEHEHELRSPERR